MDNQKIKILLIEENPTDTLQISEILKTGNISYEISIVNIPNREQIKKLSEIKNL